MLKRKVYQKLLEWKRSPGKKALCLTGARQTGKSTIAREFGHNEYECVIEINFIEHPEYKSDFSLPDPDRILLLAASHADVTVVPGNTLLILDEIQECPEARTAVKFLVENGTVDILETGSLLGVILHEVRSYPVGFEQIEPMFPLDFEEFLWAVGTKQETIQYLHDCYTNLEPVAESLHSRFLELYYRYLIIGGMPEAVQMYVNTLNLSDVNMVQKRIMDLYRLDIIKYAKDEEKIRISGIFDSIPAQLDEKNKRFILTKVRKTARMERYENSFLWLKEAGVALPSYNLSELKLPLLLNEKRNLFRLFLCDTGLLASTFSAEIQYQILQGNLQINFGAVVENAVAQALVSKELSLHYYDNKKTELDFVVQQGSSLDILEIKSGNDYGSHPSLTRVLASHDSEIRQAIVVCKGNLQKSENILYLPFYMLMFYQQKDAQNFVLLQDARRLFGL